VLPAQTVKGVRLVADPGATARVKVEDENGKRSQARPCARIGRRRTDRSPAHRRAARRVAFDGDSGDVVLGGDEMLGSAVTDAEGIALVTGLPSGAAELRAEHASSRRPFPLRWRCRRSARSMRS